LNQIIFYNYIKILKIILSKILYLKIIFKLNNIWNYF
jgi:hypothetical protein